MTNTIKYPFSDQDMVYDYNSHRYILTAECVNSELGLNLREEGNVEDSTNPSAYSNQVLKRISRMVYNYVLETVSDSQYWYYLLAKTPSVRDKLKQMMLAQMEYMTTVGSVVQMSGINPSTGSVTDLNAIRGRAKVADEVEQIANQNVREWGVCMRYIGIGDCMGSYPNGGDW